MITSDHLFYVPRYDVTCNRVSNFRSRLMYQFASVSRPTLFSCTVDTSGFLRLKRSENEGKWTFSLPFTIKVQNVLSLWPYLITGLYTSSGYAIILWDCNHWFGVTMHDVVYEILVTCFTNQTVVPCYALARYAMPHVLRYDLLCPRTDRHWLGVELVPRLR